MALSVWMVRATPVPGGLLVPGRSTRRGCWLLLEPTGARVGADDLAVDLPYESYGARGDDAWTLSQWTTTRGGGSIGVAVQGTGRWAAALGPLRGRRRSLGGWLDRVQSSPGSVPLYLPRTVSLSVDADRSVLDVLLQTLARRPAWRPQLASPERVAQLLRDLDTHDHREVFPITGARRRTFETVLVLQRLGYVHPLRGRPLPGDPRPDGEQVVAAVLEALAANRYALPADEAQVRALVHRRYLDVAPWPLAAMLPDTAMMSP